MVANTKIGILVVVKIPIKDFSDSGDWYYVVRMEVLEAKDQTFYMNFFATFP